MNILAIDPGPVESAYVFYDTGDDDLIRHGKLQNAEMLSEVARRADTPSCDKVVIEMIACYGMAVGAEVFETCVWIGRFMEAWLTRASAPVMRVKRHEVKMHLCKHPRANDSNIRQALIDLYGPGKEKAIGTKKAPGPLYGIKGDEWAALAVAVTAKAKMEQEPVASAAGSGKRH